MSCSCDAVLTKMISRSVAIVSGDGAGIVTGPLKGPFVSSDFTCCNVGIALAYSEKLDKLVSARVNAGNVTAVVSLDLDGGKWVSGEDLGAGTTAVAAARNGVYAATSGSLAPLMTRSLFVPTGATVTSHGCIVKVCFFLFVLLD